MGDSMQSALETEAKGKAEGTSIKKYQLQVRDAQGKVDEESQAKSGAADAKVSADRKAAAMQNTLEESRALLETADRQRRAAEQELADTNENLADLSNVNQSIAAAKRKLESEFNQLTGDLDEMTNEAKFSEDKVNALKGGRKAMIKMETRIRELESELDAETR